MLTAILILAGTIAVAWVATAIADHIGDPTPDPVVRHYAEAVTMIGDKAVAR